MIENTDNCIGHGLFWSRQTLTLLISVNCLLTSTEDALPRPALELVRPTPPRPHCVLHRLLH